MAARRSQQAARDEQELDSARSGRASPRSTQRLSSPFVVGEAPLLSRSGRTPPAGKFDAELPKVRIHSETVALLQLRASEHGVPLSEFLRIVAECVAYGTDNAASVAAERIRKVGALMGGIAPQGRR
jgi:hypothetical protein